MTVQEKIRELLESNGYKSKELYIEDHDSKIRLEFDHIYCDDQNKEAYILIEKQDMFTGEEIYTYEKEILWFINWYEENNVLPYNITLLLVCPYEIHEKKEEVAMTLDFITKHERNKHICRKIFINSAIYSGEEYKITEEEKKYLTEKNLKLELEILPFKPLDVIQIPNNFSTLDNNVKLVLRNQDYIYEELLKDTANMNIALIREFFERL